MKQSKLINTIYKGLWYLLAFMVLALQSSCRDTFFKEVENLRDLSTEEKLNSLLKGAKAGFNDPVFWRDFWLLSDHADDLCNFADITPGSGSNGNYNSPYDIYAKTYFKYERKNFFSSKNFYKPLYTNIASLNGVIQEEAEDKTSIVYNSVFGEAYLFRAYCYFLLIRTYKDIPLVTDTDVNYEIELSTSEEVYQLIVSDLEKAIELLPDEVSEERLYTKLVAKAVLSQVYLCMAGYPVDDVSKYTKVAELTKEIIDSDLFSLETDYKSLQEMKYGVESMFPVFMSSYSARLFPGASQKNNSLVQVRFYNECPKDYRKKCMLKTYYLGTNHEFVGADDFLNDLMPSVPMVVEIDSIPEEYGIRFVHKFDLQCTRYDYGREFRYEQGAISKFGIEIEQNICLNLLRYAHVLLNYAEAKARIGDVDALAYEAINFLRRRANKAALDQASEYDLPEGLPNEQFLSEVIKERRWELFAEPEGRWFDILRLQILDEVNAHRHKDEPILKQYSSEFHVDEYYPSIPESEFYLNLNLQK